MTPADLERVLKRHHRFTNRTAVRCYCGKALGHAPYLDAPAVGMWAAHVAAEIVAVLAAQNEETE